MSATQEHAMKELTDYEDGLMMLSESIALIAIQSAALASGELLPPTKERAGFELMLDHIQAILLRAESKLTT